MRLLFTSLVFLVVPLIAFAQSAPNDAKGHSYAGKTLEELDKAIVDLGRAIQQNPNDPLNYYNRGLAEQEAAGHEAAIAFQPWTVSTPPPPTPEQIAADKEAAKYTAAALADFSKAIELNPRYTEAYLQRGKIEWGHVVSLDDAKRARADMWKAIEVDPKNAEAYKTLGGIDGDRLQAIKEYTKAIEINPKDAWAYYGRATNEQWGDKQTGDHWDAGLKDFAAAIQLNPNEKQFTAGRDQELKLLGYFDDLNRIYRDQKSLAAGQNEQTKLPGSAKKTEDVIPECNTAFEGEVLGVGSIGMVGGGVPGYFDNKVKVLQVFRGSVDAVANTVDYEVVNASTELVPQVGNRCIFLAQKYTVTGSLDAGTIRFRVFKVLTATDDNIAKVKQLIAAAPVLDK
ncbi:MAG: hypothetical protein LV481_08340 [Methylacidiphilales bacterium]|nr:hypothetical protein [Candidatus Methylacidiphilales bacterium]